MGSLTKEQFAKRLYDLFGKYQKLTEDDCGKIKIGIDYLSKKFNLSDKSPEYADILYDAESMLKKLKRNPKNIETLF